MNNLCLNKIYIIGCMDAKAKIEFKGDIKLDFEQIKGEIENLNLTEECVSDLLSGILKNGSDFI